MSAVEHSMSGASSEGASSATTGATNRVARNPQAGAFPIGFWCREKREQAGVSLSAMATALHRDISSLSRFERGQSTPRGLDDVVAAYEALAPGGSPPPGARVVERNGERNETQRAHAVNLWPIGFAALATLALISVLAFIDTSDMRDAVRVYTLALAVPICPVVAQRTLRLWRAKYVNPHRAAFGGIGLIAMLLVVISSTFDSWGYHWVYPVNISARIAGLLAIYYAWSVYSKRPSDTLF